ncbi:hypothetical protein ACUIAK_07755 [Bacillus cytotoxicus]
MKELKQTKFPLRLDLQFFASEDGADTTEEQGQEQEQNDQTQETEETQQEEKNIYASRCRCNCC